MAEKEKIEVQDNKDFDENNSSSSVGRPITNIVESIPASAEDIAKAIFTGKD